MIDKLAENLGFITHLLNTIRQVHSQHADDVCWMDIDQIFVAAGLPVPDRTVGDKDAMKLNCSRFIDNMCSGGAWKSYAELEKIIAQQKSLIRHVGSYVTLGPYDVVERVSGSSLCEICGLEFREHPVSDEDALRIACDGTFLKL